MAEYLGNAERGTVAREIAELVAAALADGLVIEDPNTGELHWILGDDADNYASECACGAALPPWDAGIPDAWRNARCEDCVANYPTYGDSLTSRRVF